MLRHAAASVFHYFKVELERETVTVGEFAGALEKVLRGLGLTLRAGGLESRSREAIETDLGRSRANPPTALNFFSSRDCETNCASSSGNPRASCAFAGCAAASSSLPARAAGAPLRKNAGTNRRVPARLPDRRAGAKRVRARRGIVFNFEFH
jgi:hypothetical protein